MLAFNDDIGQALKNLHEQDYDSEAMTLLKAAKIIRQDILNKKRRFNGEFEINERSFEINAIQSRNL
jgi:hypothetical protein